MIIDSITERYLKRSILSSYICEDIKFVKAAPEVAEIRIQTVYKISISTEITEVEIRKSDES